MQSNTSKTGKSQPKSVKDARWRFFERTLIVITLMAGLISLIILITAGNATKPSTEIQPKQ